MYSYIQNKWHIFHNLHTYARLLSARLALLVAASRSLINSGRGETVSFDHEVPEKLYTI